MARMITPSSRTALRFSNQFTIEFWFKPATLAQGSNYLVSRSTPNTSSQGAVIFGYSSNQVEFYALGYSGTNPVTHLAVR